MITQEHDASSTTRRTGSSINIRSYFALRKMLFAVFALLCISEISYYFFSAFHCRFAADDYALMAMNFEDGPFGAWLSFMRFQSGRYSFLAMIYGVVCPLFPHYQWAIMPCLFLIWAFSIWLLFRSSGSPRIISAAATAMVCAAILALKPIGTHEVFYWFGASVGYLPAIICAPLLAALILRKWPATVLFLLAFIGAGFNELVDIGLLAACGAVLAFHRSKAIISTSAGMFIGMVTMFCTPGNWNRFHHEHAHLHRFSAVTALSFVPHEVVHSVSINPVGFLLCACALAGFYCGFTSKLSIAAPLKKAALVLAVGIISGILSYAAALVACGRMPESRSEFVPLFDVLGFFTAACWFAGNALKQIPKLFAVVAYATSIFGILLIQNPIKDAMNTYRGAITYSASWDNRFNAMTNTRGTFDLKLINADWIPFPERNGVWVNDKTMSETFRHPVHIIAARPMVLTSRK